MTLLKINRLLPIYISIVPLKLEVDIQSQTKVRVRKPKKSNMAARRPFWKRHRWKSIGFCLWPPSTCIWSLKLKFQSKLDLCSGNHVVYRQTDGQTDKVNPVYLPSNFVGRGYNNRLLSLPQPMLPYCQSDLLEIYQWYSNQNIIFLQETHCVWITQKGLFINEFTSTSLQKHNTHEL